MSNELKRVVNPYASSLAQHQGNEVAMINPLGNMGGHSTSVAAAAEVARVQAQAVLAKQFPRDEKEAADKIINAFARPSLAQVSMYEYARGGTPITGLSIKAAHEMIRLWRNCDYGITGITRGRDSTEVEVCCWDLETNTKVNKIFMVPHYRDTKHGRRKLEDERDIYELIANMASRRIRACILEMIPHDIQDAVKDQIAQTMQANFQITPEYIKGILKAFEAVGVTKSQIENFLQRRIDSITPAQSVRLNTIYNSIKDGMSQPEEWFGVDDSADKGSGKTTLEDLAKEAKAKETKAKTSASTSAKTEAAPMPTPEPAPTAKPASDKPRAEQPAKKPDLADELAKIGAPVTEADVQAWCAETGQMFVPDMIISDLKSVINSVLDWQESKQE